MPERCHTRTVDAVSEMSHTPSGWAVLFVLALEPVTGTPHTTLCRGYVLGEGTRACPGLTLVPVLAVKADGTPVVLWIPDGDILATWPGPL